MDRNLQAALYCIGFLILAEIALRTLTPLEPPRRLPLERGQQASFVLGTSRTRRAVSPRIVEQTLREHGVSAPWVANVSRQGATMVGLHRLYMEEIHPIHPPNGSLVAIEVRGSGMNDSYLLPDDRAYLASDQAGLAEGPARLARLRNGGIDGTVRFLLGHLSIVSARARLRCALPVESAACPRPSSGPPDGGSRPGATGPAWAHGSKGWRPVHLRPQPDLGARNNAHRHRTQLLRDYRLGGVHAAHLRHLVRRVRADGLIPVLYIMPVTEIQRGYYPPGAYAAFLRHVKELARNEACPLVDLDSGHDLRHDHFQDTHHLAPSTAPVFSQRFARDVLLPMLDAGDPSRMRASGRGPEGAGPGTG